MTIYLRIEEGELSIQREEPTNDDKELLEANDMQLVRFEKGTFQQAAIERVTAEEEGEDDILELDWTAV